MKHRSNGDHSKNISLKTKYCVSFYSLIPKGLRRNWLHQFITNGIKEEKSLPNSTYFSTRTKPKECPRSQFHQKEITRYSFLVLWQIKSWIHKLWQYVLKINLEHPSVPWRNQFRIDSHFFLVQKYITLDRTKYNTTPSSCALAILVLNISPLYKKQVSTALFKRDLQFLCSKITFHSPEWQNRKYFQSLHFINE